MFNLLAECLEGIGCITPPPFISPGIDTGTGTLPGIVSFFNALLRVIFVVAGIYSLLNFIFAGFGFMSAGGDAKAINAAWAKIWQTLVGLLIIVASFLLAAIFGILLFKDPMAILNPKLK